MDALTSKMHTLLQPLYAGGKPPFTPTISELGAAADLAVQMTMALREYEAEGAEMCPNVNRWDDFLNAMKHLNVPKDTMSVDGHVDDEQLDKHLDDAYIDATNNLLVAIEQLMDVATIIRNHAPGVKNILRASKRVFLASSSQRHIYKEHVHYFYEHYIAGKNLAHQDEMVCYAALYQAIAQQIGYDKHPFYGLDFDEFLYDFCGIKYNTSTERRGRYRQVGDVRDACVSPETTKKKVSEKRLKMFNEYLAIIREIICIGKARKDIFTGVPQRFKD